VSLLSPQKPWKVGGQFEGAPLLLINHTGARTGKPRTNPVMYFKDGHRYLVFASKGEPIPTLTGITISRLILT